MKYAVYTIVVAGFTLAGILDLVDRNWRIGIISLGFAAMNALIFLWR